MISMRKSEIRSFKKLTKFSVALPCSENNKRDTWRPLTNGLAKSTAYLGHGESLHLTWKSGM